MEVVLSYNWPRYVDARHVKQRHIKARHIRTGHIERRQKGAEKLNDVLRKKYIPMTETIYYTLLAVIRPRHGYAIIQYVNSLTGGRIMLGTGTLYTMVGRLTADGVIVTVPGADKKTYQITGDGMELLQEETRRLEQQLADGQKMLAGGVFTV